MRQLEEELETRLQQLRLAKLDEKSRLTRIKIFTIFVEIIFQLFSRSSLYLCLMITWYCTYTRFGIFAEIKREEYPKKLAVTIVTG